MNIEEGKERGVYGGNSHQREFENHPSHVPVKGYPQPSAPLYSSGPPTQPQSYQDGPGYPVSEGGQRTKGYDALPCCGIGIGWFLFIFGFFVGAIPWYVGAIMLCCVKNKDKREKPGLIACAIAAVIATIVTIAVIVAMVIISIQHPTPKYVYPCGSDPC